MNKSAPSLGATNERPESARRFVRLFDFEDPDNPDPVPPGWLRAQEDPTLVPSDRFDGEGNPIMRPRSPRPGFPPHNEAAYDNAVAFSGRASVLVPAAGGSASLRLQSGELPIFADADYAVTARVRTRGVQHGAAYVTARLLDASLHAIADSEKRSRRVSDEDGDGWSLVSVELPGEHPTAAWLQIDLEVLQSRQWRSPGLLGAHEVWEEDLQARAWFDDVLVYLQPRARLRMVQSCNVAIASEPVSEELGTAAPVLEASVRDLGGDELRATMRVFDLLGREVAQREFRVDPSGLPERWRPELPGFGFYRVRLDVLSSDAAAHAPGQTGQRVVVASSTLPIAFLGDLDNPALSPEQTNAYLQDFKRFGIIGDETDLEHLTIVNQAIQRLGTRFLTLPIFSRSIAKASAKDALNARASEIESILARGQELTFTIEGAPTELVRSAALDPGDPLAMVSRPAEEWFTYMQPVLDRFGQQVRRYQVGAAGEGGADALFWRSNLGPDLGILRSRLETLVPGPRLSIAWRAEFAPPPAASEVAASGAADAVALWCPTGLGSDQLPDLVKAWSSPASGLPTLGQSSLGNEQTVSSRPSEFTLIFEVADPAVFSPHDSVRELSKSIIRAWSAIDDRPGTSNVRIAIPAPWDHAPATSGSLTPRAEWPVFANLARQLAGRRVIGTYPSEPGVVCLILAHTRGVSGGDTELTRGVLVTWREQPPLPAAVRATTGRTNFTLPGVNVGPLGENIEVVDIFGNRRTLSDSERLSGLEPGDTPMFVEGIDPYLATFVSGMRLEPRFVESIAAEHEAQVVLTNPWPIRITGSLQIREGDLSGNGGRANAVSTRRNAWSITPAGIVDFAIGPDETYRLPISFTFGPAQLAGLKPIELLARVTADRDYPLLKLATSMEIGLKDFQLDLEAQRLPTTTGPDTVVIASVTNTSTRARSLRLEAATPNLPTQQLQVSDLGPGQTIVKRFSFRGSGPSMAGRPVIVSISDLEEAKRLNKSIVAP